MDLKQADIFLEEIEKISIKIPKKEKTFMQISGYPHLENVCSNILSFYLNPREEHGFKDKILKSLLDIAKEKEEKISTDIDISSISVFREYCTESGNRIDIVLQNNEIVIGIENKINASVYNDLMDYSKTLEKMNKNAVKILLSLYDESNIAMENGFINITYNELFRLLKTNLDNYNDTRNKWYIYLIDFIKNLEGFGVEKNMELEINEWIKNHKKDIKNFYELLNVAKNSLDKKIKEYGRIMEEKIKSYYKVKYWQEIDVELGAYILLERLGCNLDVLLTVDGWKLGLNIWKKANQIKIKQALNKNDYSVIEEKNTHIYLCELEYDCLAEEIAEKAKKILDILQSIN